MVVIIWIIWKSKRFQFALFITVRMGEGSNIKLDDADQIGEDVNSWQGDIEDCQQNSLFHLLECGQHFLSLQNVLITRLPGKVCCVVFLSNSLCSAESPHLVDMIRGKSFLPVCSCGKK